MDKNIEEMSLKELHTYIEDHDISMPDGWNKKSKKADTLEGIKASMMQEVDENKDEDEGTNEAVETFETSEDSEQTQEQENDHDTHEEKKIDDESNTEVNGAQEEIKGKEILFALTRNDVHEYLAEKVYVTNGKIVKREPIKEEILAIVKTYLWKEMYANTTND